MSHRLHTELQGRLYDALATDYYLSVPQVKALATTAIEVIFDDLIAGAEFRVAHAKDELQEAVWKRMAEWVADRKAEVLS
jgi:hypothetical protein